MHRNESRTLAYSWQKFPRTVVEARYYLLACAKREGVRLPIVMALGLGRPHPIEAEHIDSNNTTAAPRFIDPKAGVNLDDATLVQSFLREEFTRIVPEGSEYLYKITVALSEMLLMTPVVGGPSLDGLVYAPVKAEWGTNLVLSACSSDELLYPMACWEMITAYDPRVSKVRALYLARSISITKNGDIDWETPTEPQPLFSD